MSTDLKKKLGSFISLAGSALMLSAALMIIGVPPFSAPGFEDIFPFALFPGAMLAVAGQFMRQRASKCSEEDVEAEQEA